MYICRCGTVGLGGERFARGGSSSGRADGSGWVDWTWREAHCNASSATEASTCKRTWSLPVWHEEDLLKLHQSPGELLWVTSLIIYSTWMSYSWWHLTYWQLLGYQYNIFCFYNIFDKNLQIPKMLLIYFYSSKTLF